MIVEQTSGIKALLLKLEFENLGRRGSRRRPVSGSMLGVEDVKMSIPRNEVLNERK